MVRVMLVDDEDTIRRAVKRLLVQEEPEVKIVGECSNALDALAEMTNEMPDILITDVKMPVMSGIELIRRAKEMYPFLQCVILSGYDEFSLAQAAMSEGVRHYLLKPCSGEQVAEVIHKCVAQMEKDRKAIIKDSASRDVVLKRMMGELLELTEEGHQISVDAVRRVMDSEGDAGLLCEAAVTLVLRRSSEGGSSRSLQLISRIYEAKERICEVVCEMLREYSLESEEDEGFINKIKKFVDENHHMANLTLRYVAEQVVYMNAQYVGKQFYKQTGLKFNEYLLKVRIEHSMQMLSGREKYKMYEIAETVGLGKNIQYFYQLFKKYTGMTPREYQEKLS